MCDVRAKEKVRNAQNTAEAQRRIFTEPACREAERSIGAHSEKGYFAHFMWMYIRTYTDKEKTKGAEGGVGDPSVGKASQIQIPRIHTKARWAWQTTHNPTAQAVLEGSWLAR